MAPGPTLPSPRGLSSHNEGALEPYLRAIRGHWKLVAAVTVLTVLAAGAWLSVRSPEYDASAQILVAPIPTDDSTFEGIAVLRNDVADSTRTVQTAATLIDSSAAADRTARRLGDGFTRESVDGAVQVQTQGETNILSVEAKADSPTRAAQLANVFAEEALAVRSAAIRTQATAKLTSLRQILDSGNLNGQAATELAQSIERLQSVSRTGDPAFSLTQRAFPPGAATATSPVVIMVLAVLAGFTLGSAAALLIELLNRRIRDEAELRAVYPLPVLAHVPVATGRSQRIALRSPLSTPAAIQEAFRTLQVQLDRQSKTPRVLMFTSASSGDAKTTSAANLAVSLVAAGHRVILIDFDLRKPDIGNVLGARPTEPLVSILSSGRRLEDVLVDAPSIPALRLLLPDDERDVRLLEALSKRLPALFQEARSLADYVVVDTPPLGEVSDALRLVDLADDLVVTARPGNTNRANLELLRDLLARTGREPTGMLVIGDAPGSVSTYYTYGAASRGPRSPAASASGSR